MPHLPDIKNQLSSGNLFDAFKRQLTKDFEQSNFPTRIVESLEPHYESLHKKIALELQSNENKSDFTLMKLLNRIDISETQLKKYLTENKDKDYFNVLAELIIKRVLQKVVIKQHYKNQ